MCSSDLILGAPKRAFDSIKGMFGGMGSLSKAERDAIEQKMPGKPMDLKGMKPEDMYQKMPGRMGDMRGKKPSDFLQNMRGQGAITETERSVTVSPAGKKRGGRAC